MVRHVQQMHVCKKLKVYRGTKEVMDRLRREALAGYLCLQETLATLPQADPSPGTSIDDAYLSFLVAST